MNSFFIFMIGTIAGLLLGFYGPFLGIASELFFLFIGVFLGLIIDWIIWIRHLEMSKIRLVIDKVAEATRAFYKPGNKNTGALTNKYRLALGVIIDNISSAYAENRLPTLINVDKDRWELYFHYVQPVASELNIIMNSKKVPGFLLPKGARELANLCRSIEDVVSEEDSAAAYSEEDRSEETEKKLTTAYDNLETAWDAWKKAAGVIK